FFFQAEDGIRDFHVTGVQTCALPILSARTESEPSTVVFYYGDNPVASQLSRFDLAVVEPDTGFVPALGNDARTHWFAYVSVGERSEERRVGKEGRSRGWWEHYKT